MRAIRSTLLPATLASDWHAALATNRKHKFASRRQKSSFVCPCRQLRKTRITGASNPPGNVGRYRARSQTIGSNTMAIVSDTPHNIAPPMRQAMIEGLMQQEIYYSGWYRIQSDSGLTTWVPRTTRHCLLQIMDTARGGLKTFACAEMPAAGCKWPLGGALGRDFVSWLCSSFVA